MSYYILPKNNNIINIKPTVSSEKICEPFLSNSVYYYYNEIRNQIVTMCSSETDLSFNTYEEIIKIVNPYEYIFSKVPGSLFSVSKLKPKTNLFYDFFEVANILNVFDCFKNRKIRSLHVTKHHDDSIDCFEMLRENFSDDIIYSPNINDEMLKSLNDSKFDFLFFETNNESINSYIISFIEFIMLILRNQNKEGMSVIKISHIFHKPIVDILYLLTSLFEKVYIIKPNTSNITSFDKYIVCKKFIIDENKLTQYKINYIRMFVFLKKLDNNNILSIIDCDIPYYFNMKLDDMNIILGQQQLEILDQVITILKNKNKDDRIETIKKINILRSVNWCEKYKIPCNKFTDKINIFLPIIKEIKEDKDCKEDNDCKECKEDSIL